METISLRRVWQVGNLLGTGGFGRIYEAKADDGSEAVVKLVPKVPGARRELLFENLSGLPNIIPIFDIGEWKESYVIVMPRAVKSLRQHLESSGGKLSFDETIAVLTDVAQGLAALNAEVVHRDLKPENILLYESHWCLTDFGIARYAEATTAPDTRKFMLTPSYAAPEQWRMERATWATDVYAFGVMAFELLQGKLPFPGPEDSDFREQHLNQAPLVISGCPPSFASLVNSCLMKFQGARPTSANILSQLQPCQPASSAASRLQAVNKAIAEKQSVQQALISAQRELERRRDELVIAGEQSLMRIREEIQRRALEAAPATTVSTERDFMLQLGDGALIIDPIQSAPAECLAAYDYAPTFDVIIYTAIAAHKPQDRFGYEGRSHSLWFCDAHDEGVYRWYELAFMVNPFVAERYTLDPFALPPTDENAAQALTPVMTVRQVAWQPLPFDQGNEEQFIERWLTWFAAAADGSLGHPSQMPENSGGKYRRAQRR